MIVVYGVSVLMSTANGTEWSHACMVQPAASKEEAIGIAVQRCQKERPDRQIVDVLALPYAVKELSDG